MSDTQEALLDGDDQRRVYACLWRGCGDVGVPPDWMKWVDYGARVAIVITPTRRLALVAEYKDGWKEAPWYRGLQSETPIPARLLDADGELKETLEEDP